MFTPEELRALELHDELAVQVQELLDKQDKLLDPLVKLVLLEENIEKAQWLIRQLPTCYQKLELKAWLNHKMGLVN